MLLLSPPYSVEDVSVVLDEIPADACDDATAVLVVVVPVVGAERTDTGGIDGR